MERDKILKFYLGDECEYSNTSENDNNENSGKIKSQNVLKIKENLDELKRYLNNILLLETNSYTLKQRLVELHELVPKAEREAFESRRKLLHAPKKRIEKIQDEKKEVLKHDVKMNIHLDMFPLELPQRPSEPERPKRPILEKPGFLNRKKILAANAEKEAAFDKAMNIYEEKVEEYDAAIKDYSEQVDKLKKKQYSDYEAAIKNAETEKQIKIDEIETRLKQAKKELKETEQKSSETETAETEFLAVIKKELGLAEKQLKQTSSALKDLYESGIIFGKYRDFVAVSSFYEYLMAGRCETLEGTNGAYNLYENELRANIIIGQLADIVTSLDKIKSNQYMIYSAINNSNRQLDTLNIQMKKAAISLSNIEYKTSLIAYNTEMTAFYAKKNSELTNSLGYLIALT